MPPPKEWFFVALFVLGDVLPFVPLVLLAAMAPGCEARLDINSRSAQAANLEPATPVETLVIEGDNGYGGDKTIKLKVVERFGCEYVTGGGYASQHSGSYVLIFTHKGNCKFCVARQHEEEP